MNHPILIRRLTGTNKGKDEILHTQEVSFGTGPNNTVRFDPTWDRGVSSSHARLYRDAEGVWWLADAGSSTGTHLNGQKLTQPRALVGSFVIELGQSGPRVEVTLPADALPARDQRPSGPAHLGQGGGGRGPARKGNKLPIAIAALIALGLGALWLLRPSGSGSINVTLGGGGDSDTQIEAAAKRLESAVGKVILMNAQGQSLGTGTAWAVAPGIFATNSHITEPAKDALKTGGAVFIAINKDPSKKYRVRQAISHPSYCADMMNAQGRQSELGTYDVGLLIIKEQHSPTFQLAPVEKVRQLDAGKRVAFLGFPAEKLTNRGSDNERPVATMQTGIVTAVTDYWGSQADAGDRLLVQHNLPSTGGASGSPIFDQNGEVVAVLCAGNITYTLPSETKHAVERAKARVVAALDDQLSAENLSAEDKAKAVEAAKARLSQLSSLKVSVEDLERAPSAAQINFAQRVDILQELLDAYQQAVKEDSAQ
jgi:V8-like Glu-specific endopeptidase